MLSGSHPPRDAEPSEPVVIPCSRFPGRWHGQCQHDVRISTAPPPMCSRGRSPGNHRWRMSHPQRSWPGIHLPTALSIQPFPITGLPFPPPGLGLVSMAALDHRSYSNSSDFQTLPNTGQTPHTALAILDLISSSTCQIRFNANLSYLLTLPSCQDLFALPSAPLHLEQNSSPGGSCKLSHFRNSAV